MINTQIRGLHGVLCAHLQFRAVMLIIADYIFQLKCGCSQEAASFISLVITVAPLLENGNFTAVSVKVGTVRRFGTA